ncbi:MAG: hypothetical protein U1E91_01185 [Moraxella sp.]
MSEIQFNANLKKAENAEPLTEQQLEALAQKRAYLQEQAEDIIAIAQLQHTLRRQLFTQNQMFRGTRKSLQSGKYPYYN